MTAKTPEQIATELMNGIQRKGNFLVSRKQMIIMAITAAIQSERDAKSKEAEGLRERIAQLEDALIWCSGSNDFAPGGKAREGWERICKPLLTPAPTGEKEKEI